MLSRLSSRTKHWLTLHSVDEWPPALFWTAPENRVGTTVWIRYIDSTNQQNAGGQWRGVCRDNALSSVHTPNNVADEIRRLRQTNGGKTTYFVTCTTVGRTANATRKYSG